jgi:hypothetical protein
MWIVWFKGCKMYSFSWFSCACSLFRPPTVRGALSAPHTSRALESATQGHTQDRDSRAALGNTLRTRGNFQEGVPGMQRGQKAKPPRPTYSIFRSDCHLPAMIRLTGGYARCSFSCSSLSLWNSQWDFSWYYRPEELWYMANEYQITNQLSTRRNYNHMYNFTDM